MSTGPVAETVVGAPTERTATINMKDRQESEILGKLMEITKAKPVRPTAEELQQIRELEEQKAKSDAVRVLSLAEKARRQREKDILNQARGEVENATS
jgi:large subunit ribosomal protein MRP49